MKKLLLIPALLCLHACDKAEEKKHSVAPAVLPAPAPKPRPAPAPAASDSRPATDVATGITPPPPAPPPPPPTAEEMAALQKEAEEVVKLGAPLLEGGTVADTQALKQRIMDLLKRRGKMMPAMTPDQRAAVAKDFTPVLQLRAKLNPQPDVLKKLREARSQRPAAPAQPTPPSADDTAPPADASPPPEAAPPQ